MPQRQLVDNGDLGSSHTMSITNGFSLKFHGPWRWASVCAVMALTACGGGGSQPDSSLDALIGVWKDHDSSRKTLAAVVLPDKNYWVFYGSNTINPTGFDQGVASANDNIFAASVYEFSNQSSRTSASVNARFSSNRITGELSYPSAPLTNSFDLTRMLVNEFNTENTARTSDIKEGRWTGKLSGLEAWLQKNALGDGFSGQDSNGCQYDLTFTPMSNFNAFTVTMDFLNATCADGISRTTGLALIYQPSRETPKQMLLAVQNFDRSKGWLFSATQP